MADQNLQDLLAKTLASPDGAKILQRLLDSQKEKASQTTMEGTSLTPTTEPSPQNPATTEIPPQIPATSEITPPSTLPGPTPQSISESTTSNPTEPTAVPHSSPPKTENPNPPSPSTLEESDKTFDKQTEEMLKEPFLQPDSTPLPPKSLADLPLSVVGTAPSDILFEPPLRYAIPRQEGFPIDAEEPGNLKLISDAVQHLEGKMPERRSERIFEESVKKQYKKHAAKRRKKVKPRQFQRSLTDTPHVFSKADNLPDQSQMSDTVLSEFGSDDLDDSADEDYQEEPPPTEQAEEQADSSGEQPEKKKQKPEPATSTKKPMPKSKKSVSKPVKRPSKSVSPDRSEIKLGKRPKVERSESIQASLPKEKGTQSSSDDDNSDYDASRSYSVKYYHCYAKTLKGLYSKKEFRMEKLMDSEMFNKFGLDILLRRRGLLRTVSDFSAFSPTLILEFFANMLKDEVFQSGKPKFGKSFVRGKIVKFDPDTINKFLGLKSVKVEALSKSAENEMTAKITGGKSKVWTSKLPVSSLTWKYVALFKISVHNWMPNKNLSVLSKEQAEFLYRVGCGLPFNFGQIVFTNIFRAVSKSDSTYLPHPCLLYALLLSQGITPVEEELQSDPVPLVFEQSLTRKGDTRVKDLPYIPSDASEDEDVDVGTSFQDQPSKISQAKTLLKQAIKLLQDLE